MQPPMTRKLPRPISCSACTLPLPQCRRLYAGSAGRDRDVATVRPNSSTSSRGGSSTAVVVAQMVWRRSKLYLVQFLDTIPGNHTASVALKIVRTSPTRFV